MRSLGLGANTNVLLTLRSTNELVRRWLEAAYVLQTNTGYRSSQLREFRKTTSVATNTIVPIVTFRIVDIKELVGSCLPRR
jgi:hypothetical protein